MNKARFARLSKLIEELSAIRDEEQDAFDNLPENFQYGSQGETMQEGITASWFIWNRHHHAFLPCAESASAIL